MNFYELHGLLQMLAFFILFPIGAAIAFFRDRVGPSWKQYHVAFQLTATFVVFLAVSSVLYAKSQDKEKQTHTNTQTQENKIRRAHKILGPIVVSVIVIQLFWAYQGRKLVEWNTWYITHMAFSAFIILGGITNVILGMLM